MSVVLPVNEHRRNALRSVVLAAAVLAVYAQVRRYGFVEFDDQTYVTANPMVLRGLTAEGLRWAFTSGHTGNWHPVTWLSHMADVALFGVAPGAHHLVNVALHVANTVLLFAVLRRMTGAAWPSFVVAALFGLHPLHVESVAWVSERKDVLSTLFWLLTLWAYARYAERRSGRWYVAALVFFALGLMAKTMLVTVPFVLLLIDAWPLQRVAWPATSRPGPRHRAHRRARTAPGTTIASLLREKIPFFVVTAAFSATALLTQREAGAMVRDGGPSLGLRVENALIAYTRYLGKTVWPVNLAVLYPYDPDLSVSTAAAAAVALAAVTVASTCIAPRRPYALVGWLWFVGTLCPVIGLVQVGNQAMADRFTYVPLIGIFIAVVWGAADVASRWAVPRPVVVAGTAGLLGVLAVAAFRQAALWRDGETLLSHAAAVTEGNYIAHNNLGVALAARGDADAALRHYREAVRIKPDYADGHDNVASILKRQGRIDEAIAEYRLAIRYGNAAGDDARLHLANVHHELALLLYARGERDDAITHLREAVRLQPDFAGAHFNLGNAYRDTGRLDDAATEYRETVRLVPADAEAHANLGALLSERGRIDEARAELITALHYDPHSDVALTNLGIALRRQGTPGDAVAALRELVARTPDAPEARHQLGIALIEANDPEAAIAHLEWTVERRPEDPHAQNDLGVALTRTGRLDEAIHHLREALRIDPELSDAQYDLQVALTMKAADPSARPASQ